MHTMHSSRTINESLIYRLMETYFHLLMHDLLSNLLGKTQV